MPEPDQKLVISCIHSLILVKSFNLNYFNKTFFYFRWVTTENIRVPEDPFFFCDKCFRQFNYEPETNKKIGSFKAQPYFDRNALM